MLATSHTHMPPSRGSMLEAEPPCARPAAFFPYVFSALSTSLSFILSLSFHSYATYVFLKSVRAAPGDGGEGLSLVLLAFRGWTELSSFSIPPASSQLSFSKISREDPQPLRGEAGTNWHVCRIIWNNRAPRKVTFLEDLWYICKLFFPAQNEPLFACWDHACTYKNMCVGVLWKTNASCFPNPVWLQSHQLILTCWGKYRITVIEESGVYYSWSEVCPLLL